MPLDYVCLTTRYQDDVFDPRVIDREGLPAGWRQNEKLTRSIGDQHFAGDSMRPLKVPSVVVPQEWNILFTPVWSAAGNARVVSQQPIDMDPRLWTV
jgi:RES domain-containing protein